MQPLRVLPLSFVLLLLASAASATPVHLQTEHRTQPLDIDVAAPRFAWQSDARTPDWMQQAYQVQVSTDEAALSSGRADIWDSGRIVSSDSVNIAYAGPALRSETRYYWTVRVWDNKGASEVSASTWFETGLLSPSDWKSQWIYRSDPAAARTFSMVRWLSLPGADAEHVKPHTNAQFRYVLHLDTPPLRASLHVLARGGFTATVNGEQTGQHTHWNAFDWEEITPHLRPGDNEILVQITSPQGEQPDQPRPAAFAATIHITDKNGREQRIVSDRAWTARSGDHGPWFPAQDVGPLRAHPAQTPPPHRIATEASLLRKDFTVQQNVRSARLIVTALGAYEAWLNGSRIAPLTLLSPGFTDFRKRVLYRTYDLTALVTPGQNTLGLMLGGGWHGSPLTWSGTRYFTGPDMLRAQLEIIFEDGRKQLIATDNTWQAAAAPVLSSEIYGGEDYDARGEQTGWSKPGFAARGWSHADLGSTPPDLHITAAPDAPITTILTLHPASLDVGSATHPAVFDMGQNMVGNVRLHISGPRGAVVRLRYAERLNPDGSIYTENLRNATVTDYFTLSGEGDETYTPHFTFHGFRYVEVSGYTAGLKKDSIEGLVYNSLPEQPSMRLHTSSDLLNSMAKLGFWGQRGNFFSIPTDCPQRDERLGWMGDAGVFWRTGTYNFDIASFTQKFMNDIVDAQEANGSFTDISPDLLQPEAGAPGWADAGILVPYAAWLQYGDTALLKLADPGSPTVVQDREGASALYVLMPMRV